MGLVFDSNVFIRTERDKKSIDFSLWKDYGDVFISVVTVSELLVGVHRVDTEARHIRRAAFVESILTRVGILDFTTEVARLHAELFATLAKQGQMIGAHDLIIAATALTHGFPVLTADVTEFKRVPGLTVLNFTQN
ncbi:type II toxin-antitoxin system VapC family toxin [Candidatus Parabeggiatoa sp. HSG14]|uniref:type II toxin-antitoxin system VapC family toxin n=1 Tax=Candidatus Parabeggiatoa sp. HSG14 TaxID=3055593 RepID=UPI0025A74806|nr:type II toxin-antitoxin system VapC family toxin [Thiotrichales bacterium HSG14]